MQQQILLIDDAKQIHTLVTSLLGEEPVQIESAFDPQYGLTLAASMIPDLILLDIEMPGLSGYEVCRQLKANPATATIPIIFLTAMANTDEIVRGLNLGAVDYVTKPFKLSEMLSRVRAALRTSRLIRLLEEQALIDSMTGLGNRAMFAARLEAEVALRIRSGNPLSCIALDVDIFNFIDDRFGRPFGDYILSEISAAVRKTCRKEDIACHLERGRFAILLPYTSVEEAAILAEHARGSIAKIPFSREGKSFPVSCSLGVAQSLQPYDRSLLDRAQSTADRSQSSGGDRVLVDPTQPPATSVAA